MSMFNKPYYKCPLIQANIKPQYKECLSYISTSLYVFMFIYSSLYYQYIKKITDSATVTFLLYNLNALYNTFIFKGKTFKPIPKDYTPTALHESMDDNMQKDVDEWVWIKAKFGEEVYSIIDVYSLNENDWIVADCFVFDARIDGCCQAYSIYIGFVLS